MRAGRLEEPLVISDEEREKLRMIALRRSRRRKLEMSPAAFRRGNRAIEKGE